MERFGRRNLDSYEARFGIFFPLTNLSKISNEYEDSLGLQHH